jgi:hypothetical protein
LASGAKGCGFDPRRAHFRNFEFRNPDFGLLQRIEPAEQIFFARDAGDLITQLPVFKKEEGRDGANVVLER